MFKRIICEDWTVALPVIAFAFTFAVFAFTTIRAVRMPKSRREELAAIPLDNGDNHSCR